MGSRKKMREEVSIQDLEYADDTTLVSDFLDVLEEVLRTLHTTCSRMGLQEVKYLSCVPHHFNQYATQTYAIVLG